MIISPITITNRPITKYGLKKILKKPTTLINKELVIDTKPKDSAGVVTVKINLIPIVITTTKL